MVYERQLGEGTLRNHYRHQKVTGYTSEGVDQGTIQEFKMRLIIHLMVIRCLCLMTYHHIENIFQL